MKIRATAALFLLLPPACVDDGGQAETLLADAEELVAAARNEQSAAGKLPLLENARGKLHRIVGYHPSTTLAADLREGRVAGTLSLAAVDQQVRHARMDACLGNVGYECLIESALAAARVHLESGQGHDTIAVAQARLGDTDGALATVDELLGSGLAIPEWRTAALLELIAPAQAAKGDVEGALATAERIRQLNATDERVELPGHVQAAIAVAQARAGEPDSALVTSAGLPEWEAPLFAHVLTHVARARAGTGDAEGAAQALDAAAALLGPDMGIYPLFPLDRHSVQIQFRGIAEAQVDMGDIQGAVETVSRAIEVAEQVQSRAGPEINHLVHALADFASMWAAIGEEDRAARLLARARSSAGQLDGDRRYDALRLLVPFLGEFGAVDTARALADSLANAGRGGMVPEWRSWWAISERLVAEGETDGATRAADRIDRGFHGLAAHIRVASAWARSGDTAAAVQLLTGIVADVSRDGVPGHEWETADRYAQAALLRLAAGGLAEAGDMEAAVAALAEALSAASRIEAPSEHLARFLDGVPVPDLLPPDDSVAAFVGALAEAGDLIGHQWLWAWEDGFYRGWALQAIACVAESEGIPLAPEALREAAMAMGEPRYDVGSWVLRAVALALLERPCPDEVMSSTRPGSDRL